ncbi:hypothetical protein, partial [Plasmodium yoelii yoelii]
MSLSIHPYHYTQMFTYLESLLNEKLNSINNNEENQENNLTSINEDDNQNNISNISNTSNETEDSFSDIDPNCLIDISLAFGIMNKMSDNSHEIPNNLVDILISLNLEDPKYPKNLQVVTNYLNEDLIKNTNKLVNYIIDNINVGQINNNISNYLADIIIYIQKANAIENSEELKKNAEAINTSLIWEETCSIYPEYRIKINDEKLKKYLVNDYRYDIINNCTKHINYLKLLYVVSNNILPQNGYMLFINIIHNIDINYQYKLLSLEYFAHVANKITLERAKYIAQILPIVLDKFYNIDGEPYYNDNINNIDTLISMCKFINILCDKSIKSQEDDKQDVALHSIVAFIMRIICYHNFYLPLNKNVEQIFPYIKYDSIDYNECINVYKTIPLVSYRNKSDHIIRE